MKKLSVISIIYACFAGFCLFIIAMGIFRFSYGPIIPFLVKNKWATPPQAGYIGSSNFLGYFLGAYIAPKLTRYVSMNKVMVAALAFSIIASFLSSWNVDYIWLGAMRFIVGIVAGIIMVLSPTLILFGIPPRLKSILSGVMFSGVGIGIFATSCLIPVFYKINGVFSIWLWLAIMTVVLALISFKKCLKAPSLHKEVPNVKKKLDKSSRLIFFAALLGYFLYGVGITPTTLFLSTYAYHDLGASLHFSSILFSIFGIGCFVGSLVAGWMNTIFNNYLSIIVIAVIGIISLIVIVLFHSIAAVGISSFLSGFYLIGNVVIISSLLESIAGVQNHAKYWSYMTLAYAVGQFISAYLLSYSLNFEMSYHSMFIMGLIVLIFSLIAYLFTKRKSSLVNSSNREY